MVSDKQIEAAAKAIYANAKNTDARDIARIALTAAEQAEPAPAARSGVVKPLDLSNLLRHAFISGFTANGGDIDVAAMEWTEYDPNVCAAYSRILSALTAGKPEQHPDDEAVDRFAAAMKAKLKWEREERGRYGWNDPEVCSEEYLAKLLIEHLAKGNDGNFEDVANFCMMLHQRAAHPRVLAAAFAKAGKPEQSAWRPIETAPKDGTQFQAWIEKYGWEPRARFNPDSEAFELWGRVDYDKDGWDVYPHMVPTHWMPFPTPPTAGGGDA